MHPKVHEALLCFLNQEKNLQLGNPSSIHFHGRAAKKIIHESKSQIYSSFEISEKEYQIHFTHSGTAANQLALYSYFFKNPSQKNTLITSAAEHQATLSFLPYLKSKGVEVIIVPHLPTGDLDYDFLERACLDNNAALISLLWVNNETGVIYDIDKISNIKNTKNITLHVDAAQAVGKIPLHLNKKNIDYISMSGHKIGALAGSGLLISRNSHNIHFFNKNGTENSLSIFTLGQAFIELDPHQYENQNRPLLEYFEKKIKLELPGCIINAEGTSRVANTVSLSFPTLKTDTLVMELDQMGFSVSAGSACQSGSLEPSHVLLALGVDRNTAKRSIRISISSLVTQNVLDEFIDALKKLR